MDVALVYDPAVAGYRFPPGHPMRPERFTLAVSLIRAWGLLDPGTPPPGAANGVTLPPAGCSDEDLELVHSPALIAAVKAAGVSPAAADPEFGLGPGDTPAFPGMHEAASLAAGASIRALEAVLDGEVGRAFSPAGGMHHAHYDRASGFCIYNDCAVAIARAIRDRPGLRVAYIDIDAHHGDGVQAAFAERTDVLTASIHESGRYLFPGTGAASDIGDGPGRGYALNVPLPPFAGPDEFALAFDRAVAPAIRAFAPDAIFAQLGADGHRDDPLTHLANTIAGHASLVRRIARLADDVCAGRLAAVGGGGYQPFTAVPRMWACAMGELMGAPIPERVPDSWLGECAAAAGGEAALVRDAGEATFYDSHDDRDPDTMRRVRDLTSLAVEEAESASPLLTA